TPELSSLSLHDALPIYIGQAFPSLCHRGVGRCPASVLEAAPAILVRACRCLHDSIEGQIREYNDFAHEQFPPRFYLSLVGSVYRSEEHTSELQSLAYLV